MANPTTNPGGIKALSILHKTLLLGQIIFAAVAFYLIYSNSFRAALKQQEKILQVIALVICAAGFYFGTTFFKRKLLQIRDSQAATTARFSTYRSACIIQWALLEGPCLFTIICFLLTGNYAFLGLAVTLILAFALLTPTAAKIALQLQLNEQEVKEL